MNKAAYMRIPKARPKYRYVWSDCTTGHAHESKVYGHMYWEVGMEAPCGICLDAGSSNPGYVTALEIKETYDQVG